MPMELVVKAGDRLFNNFKIEINKERQIERCPFHNRTLILINLYDEEKKRKQFKERPYTRDIGDRKDFHKRA